MSNGIQAKPVYLFRFECPLMCHLLGMVLYRQWGRFARLLSTKLRDGPVGLGEWAVIEFVTARGRAKKRDRWLQKQKSWTPRQTGGPKADETS